MGEKCAVVAFSGGLDTSFCVPFIREKYGVTKVITCTVDTGGSDEGELQRITRRSLEVGADEHVVIAAAEEYYRSVVKFLIFGNVSRDGYPLCVGSERLVQARGALQLCREREAELFVHGSTGAGNDQFRFDLVAEVEGEGITCLAPVREFQITRPQASQFLKERGISVEERSSVYSYNAGLWGTSIGGGETHRADALIPEEAWPGGGEIAAETAELRFVFERGEPIALHYPGGSAKGALEVIRRAGSIGRAHGIGRHYHIGTSLVGKKGRIAYESAAADLIYEAHRTLERITLSQAQIHAKRAIADEFGRLVHEAKFFDPYIEDLKAYLQSSQARVSGSAALVLGPAGIKGIKVSSAYDLLADPRAQYGESATGFSGVEAAAACRMHSVEQAISHRAALRGEGRR